MFVLFWMNKYLRFYFLNKNSYCWVDKVFHKYWFWICHCSSVAETLYLTTCCVAAATSRMTLRHILNTNRSKYKFRKMPWPSWNENGPQPIHNWSATFQKLIFCQLTRLPNTRWPKRPAVIISTLINKQIQNITLFWTQNYIH